MRLIMNYLGFIDGEAHTNLYSHIFLETKKDYRVHYVEHPDVFRSIRRIANLIFSIYSSDPLTIKRDCHSQIAENS